MSGELRTERRVPLTNYSRVCGYYAPVQNFNLGKKAEFYDRKVYTGKLPQ